MNNSPSVERERGSKRASLYNLVVARGHSYPPQRVVAVRVIKSDKEFWFFGRPGTILLPSLNKRAGGNRRDNIPDKSDQPEKVVQLGEYRARKRPARSADIRVEEDQEGDCERFSVSFEGGPEVIYGLLVEWLRDERYIGDIIVVRPGLVELEDAPDDEWRDRYDDVIWEESLPCRDLDDDDGEPVGPFDASTLLRVIHTHSEDFKAMLEAGSPVSESENAFLAEFYRY
ncbi:hypothetical protein ELI48_02245 [Rhizobium ruizarguesonis]|uniref:hypothetical protein n=1 Tax=Rhizobium ruizarguesonis TaxID=2081791 RepID=UPI00102FCAC2|nr:hypothetical protein [Rhizobium ruizarguesonis]TAU25104.1 hypothetical protein ELI48_02245 [Rhizobium ruizarguesonis]TAW08500.1 hypothetical protein ELI26_02235 [Rhizobium ruizarguesonis]